MNREQTKEAARIMLAFANGDVINFARRENPMHISPIPSMDCLVWNWEKYVYTIADEDIRQQS